MGKMATALASFATLATEPGEDAFRKLFRFYRRGTADLGAVIDFSTAHVAPGPRPGVPKVVRVHLNVSSVTEQDACRVGLQPVSKWQAYGLEGYPGFIFIPDPFLPGCQRHWIKQCLKLYSQKPNVCNLDKHMPKEETQSLWEQSKEFLRKKERKKPDRPCLLVISRLRRQRQANFWRSPACLV